MRLIAPILSFTAEEVWGYLPGKADRENSVHLAHFLKPAVLIGEESAIEAAQIAADWTELLVIRNTVMKSLEAARKDGRIGKALEAKMRLELAPDAFSVAKKYESCLKELFNVSQVELAQPPRATAGEVIAETLPADGTKCERCWNYSTHVGEDPRWLMVCDRCAIALDAIGFSPLEARSSEENAGASR